MLLAVCLHGCGWLGELIARRSAPDRPHPPAAVERFAADANALAEEQGQASNQRLAAVTRNLSNAIEALPASDVRKDAASQVRELAKALESAAPAEKITRAKDTLTAALDATAKVRKPDSSPQAQQEAVARASQALAAVQPSGPVEREARNLGHAYREVAQAMVVVTGGEAQRAAAGELQLLATRFATEEAEPARVTGAHALMALASAIDGLPRPTEERAEAVRELRARADQLPGAPSLAYAKRMKRALESAATALDHAQVSTAPAALLVEAHRAVGLIDAERPFELQRAAVQDALRVLVDTVTLATSADRP